MSSKPTNKIAWLIRTQFVEGDVSIAGLERVLRSERTRRIYLLVQPPRVFNLPENRYVHGALADTQYIMSRLRAIYGQTGARFSVVSEKHGRLLICASLSSATTESQPSSPSSSGRENT